MSVYKAEEKTKNGRQWYYKVCINGKQYKSKKYLTKREAINEEKEFILSNSNKDLVASKITFSQAIREYLEHEKQNVKQSTYKQEITLTDHINDSLGNVVIENLKVYEWKKFRKDLLNKGLSVGYCNKVINHAKSVIKLMYVRYGVVTRVPDGFAPMKDGKIKREIDFYTPEEFKKFISVIDQYLELKWYCFFLVSYHLGTRCSENNALTWKDCDFEKRTISINKTINTKFKVDGKYLITSPKTKGSNRILPMDSAVYEALSRLKRHYQMYDGFSEKWFVYGGAKPISDTNIHKYNKIFADRAEIRAISVHGFRHSCCSVLLNSGCDILTIARLLGHSDVQKCLNTYSHLMPLAFKNATDVFEKI